MADLEGFPAANLRGARQKGRPDWDALPYLSTNFSPVGRTVLDRMPNLKAVLVRTHGTEHVDRATLRRRGIALHILAPTTENCAAWIGARLGINAGPYLFVGNGRIAKAAKDYLNPGRDIIWATDSKTDPDVLAGYLSKAATIVATVPAAPPSHFAAPVFSDWFFRRVRPGCRFISISRPETTDNVALLNAILAGRVAEAHVDTMGPHVRTELLGTGKAYWTRHTAWQCSFDRAAYLTNLERRCKEIEDGNAA